MGNKLDELLALYVMDPWTSFFIFFFLYIYIFFSYFTLI
jgi:hypothetical protein